ncbi:MAG: hypothetical protein QXT77_09475, partial [Candidatus Methanomethylicaceae archaeon]
AFLAPTVVVIADGGIGRKVGGQVAPRAAHLHQVEDGVEDDAGMVFGFASEGALGDEGADALPLGVGEVAGVASGARGALWSLCQSAFSGSHRGVIPQNLLPVHALRARSRGLQPRIISYQHIKKYIVWVCMYCFAENGSSLWRVNISTLRNPADWLSTPLRIG